MFARERASDPKACGNENAPRDEESGGRSVGDVFVLGPACTRETEDDVNEAQEHAMGMPESQEVAPDLMIEIHVPGGSKADQAFQDETHHCARQDERPAEANVKASDVRHGAPEDARAGASSSGGAVLEMSAFRYASRVCRQKMRAELG